MKNILVIGGAGYIGSHVVRALLDDGYTPIVFDNLSTGRKGFVPSGIPFIKGDLKSIRSELEVFLTSLGYEPVLNEKGHTLIGATTHGKSADLIDAFGQYLFMDEMGTAEPYDRKRVKTCFSPEQEFIRKHQTQLALEDA